MIKSAFLLFLLAAIPVQAQEVSKDPSKSTGVDQTVGVIEALENQRDPKCDATATRLENFMYGTPLAHDGREKKVDLQKALVLAVWKQASVAAQAAGASEIEIDVLRPVIERVFPYRINDRKDAIVKLADGSELLLEERDVRQYGTVAYALRAILATQQDALLTPGLDLIPFDSDAIRLTKEMVDVHTLATLNLADSAARKSGKKELSASLVADAWKRVRGSSTEPAEPSRSAALAPGKPGEVLRKIIAQKLVSFRTYNQSADPLLYSNIQSFYARHPWPEDKAAIRDVTQAFSGVVMDFIAETLLRAQSLAKAEGSPVIRERHVAAVYEKWAPYSVNIYEDVIFFGNLAKDKQVYIEAYDADSLRDSGLHWYLIQQVIDSSFPLELDLDPFAAELLAEGDAQMAVLAFRVAGRIAKDEGAEILQPKHLTAAQRLIGQRFAEQVKTKKSVKAPAKLASAPSARQVSGKFFEDSTAKSGISFMHRSSDWLSRFQRTFLYSQKGTDVPDRTKEPAEDVPPSFSGSGVAAEDINGDGWTDVLILGGRGNRLFLNNGDGTFRDGTKGTGIDWVGADGKPGEPRQPLIVDFDNDGHQDIFISYVNAPHRLYRNKGDGSFEDKTDVARLGGEGLVGGPVVAFDYDRDGLLDLYIGYYGNYLKGIGPSLSRVNHNATPNVLFRNTGGFRFKNVSSGSGVENDGWTQAAASTDFDLDGWGDLIVGNDFGVNSYYRNLGNGTFEDVAARLGTDLPSSSMNVGTADLNKDGYPDVYISNIVAMVKDEKYTMPTETTKMKRNSARLATMRVVQNNHLFTSVAPDKTGQLRYAVNEAVDPTDTSTGWAWDADFFDFDNDGDDDLYLVNGLHEYMLNSAEFKIDTPEGAKEMLFSVHERESNVFFVNDGGRLANRSAGSGTDFSGNSRSAAYLDHDNDGDLDIIVNNYNDQAVFLANKTDKRGNRWIKLRLLGDPTKKSNRDAVGARIVAVTPQKNRIWREVQSATGYLSAHPKEQHIGLGAELKADVTITWPNGDKSEHRGLKAGQVHTIKQ
ncbi:MAG TPA: FG-GAP-like repeat-containing protein [Thermoanaerobaculia bacterium]|nr:FG-GAP-like repeat-containing protein [Thermoanaerobaculia bacterium]